MKYHPLNASRSWTREELNILEVMTNDRRSNADISVILNRTPAAVAFKKSVMGYTSNKKRIPIPVDAPKIKSKKKVIQVEVEASKISSVTTRDKAKEMAKAARQIARANGKRITMAMFFVEDL
jgi:hypothetical protein